MNAAEFEDTVKADEKLRAVHQKDRHPITFLHAAAGQECREAAAQIVELSIAELVPVVDKARFVRRLARVGLEVLGNGNLPQPVFPLAGKSIRPGMFDQLVVRFYVFLFVHGE